MAAYTNVGYKDQVIENKRLELTDKGSLYFLGPNLTLRNCTLLLKIPSRNLFTTGVSFIQCTLEVKQELKNYQEWVKSSLKGCRFQGGISGGDFGHWPGYADGWEHGALEDCDFTEARLDGCRFHGCDPNTLRLPKWPCFTFLEPHRHRHEWAALSWPGNMGAIVMSGLAKNPPSTRAESWFAPTLAKQSGTTPGALKAVIEQCSNIFY